MADWIETIAGEANQKYHRAALILRTLAWAAICWAALISVFIWMGARAGSYAWFWGAIGLFVGGVIVLGIASWLQAQAAKRVIVETANKGRDVRAA